MVYKQCTKCVMDTTDPDITFDSDGVCSHCKSYEKLLETWNLKELTSKQELESLFKKIKIQHKGKKYNCIIGLSGGVDSSYIALLAKEHGLSPLCVHLDNGWNSELATANIHNIVDKCGFDLHTHVINWNEFKKLQRAFFKSNVIDIEILSDHAIFGVIIQLAKKYGIKAILSGANYSSEFILPKAWVHRKQDLINIKDINKKFGEGHIKTFPQVSTLKHVFLMYIAGYKVYKPLNLIDFNKEKAKKILKEKLDWRDYGGKHYESIFTKFYQAYILPKKFNVDKRKAHLSSLIASNQLSREDALKELEKPLYDHTELKNDREFVLKKLGFTDEWFDEYMSSPPRSHYEFKTDQKVYDFLYWCKSLIGQN